jgi:hypothetical protein
MTEQQPNFNVEGLDWIFDLDIDESIFVTPGEQYIEAASRGIEMQISTNEKLNLGPMIIVKKRGSKKEALVNSYICLNNVSQYALAETLRESYKKQSGGQDLAVDDIGFSF